MTTPTYEFSLEPAADLARMSEGAPLGEILARKALEAKQAKKPPVDLYVPRDGDWLVTFKTIIPLEVRRKWANDFKGDEVAWAIAVLSSQCVGIRLCGQEWIGADGVPVTFNHPEFKAFFEVTKTRDAIELLYGAADGIDAAAPDIDWVAMKIMHAAGIGVERNERGVPLA